MAQDRLCYQPAVSRYERRGPRTEWNARVLQGVTFQSWSHGVHLFRADQTWHFCLPSLHSDLLCPSSTLGQKLPGRWPGPIHLFLVLIIICMVLVVVRRNLRQKASCPKLGCGLANAPQHALVSQSIMNWICKCCEQGIGFPYQTSEANSDLQSKMYQPWFSPGTSFAESLYLILWTRVVW